MQLSLLNTYGAGQRSAWETLSVQLFRQHINRSRAGKLQKFRVVNGAGGDGGIEAYALLTDGTCSGVQAKWFLQPLDNLEFRQIRSSIDTARRVRPELSDYVIAIPHNPSSKKVVKGGGVSDKHEETRIEEFTKKAEADHPGLKITWWFEDDVLQMLQTEEGFPVRRYWFEKETITSQYLGVVFERQKNHQWLKERYVPEVNGLGHISSVYDRLIFGDAFRNNNFAETGRVVLMIKNTCQLLEEYVKTPITPQLTTDITGAKKQLEDYAAFFEDLRVAYVTGNDDFNPEYYPVLKQQPVNLGKLALDIYNHKRTTVQRNLASRLNYSLMMLNSEPVVLLAGSFRQVKPVLVILGDQGTGKTQGLAHCVQQHISKKLPALLIRAKGATPSSWHQLLSGALGLTGWTAEEIFSALEANATAQDIAAGATAEEGKELNTPSSKVLIAVDGLEEDVNHWMQWHDRINDAVDFSKKFPRLRFMFSARRYFETKETLLDHDEIEKEYLPHEGDVSVSYVSDKYFKEYKIVLSDYRRIKGLDNLLALRLFCEKYQGENLDDGRTLITEVNELLRLKIQSINQEFLSSNDRRNKGADQAVQMALTAIAKSFYDKSSLQKETLFDLVKSTLPSWYAINDILELIQLLCDHGILFTESRVDTTSVLGITQTEYAMTNQAIIEHLLFESVYQDIVAGKLSKLPSTLVSHPGPSQAKNISNEKIVQDIADRLLMEKSILIGENGFLIEGIEGLVGGLQLRALIHTPIERKAEYQPRIDQLFFHSVDSQHGLLNNLIIPSSSSSSRVFGSRYVHEKLLTFPSAAARDRKWTGITKVRFDLEDAPTSFLTLEISQEQDYDELPLLFAWGLTTRDQPVRRRLQVALLKWALIRPLEFIKLLDLVFDVNDPQIQEDLGSVTLGLAAFLKDADGLTALAHWAHVNVFAKKEIIRSVITRQGFRAIIERAFQKGLTNKAVLEMARPSILSPVKLLPLHKATLRSGSSEIFPIVHDLAWYVIHKAYEKFLTPPFGGVTLRNNDLPDATALLDKYRKRHHRPDLYGTEWAFAAAMEYIKNALGFTDKKGVSYTSATHGAKSVRYTLEEKYVWLTVHYLQGYLSDYLPMRDHNGRAVSVTDYSQLTEIPNPAETLDDPDHEEPVKNTIWLLQEDLVPTVGNEKSIKAELRKWVNTVPVLDLAKWIEFPGTCLHDRDSRVWTALYHDLSVKDATEYGYAHLTINAALIKDSDLIHLQTAVKRKTNRPHFLNSIERIHALPDGDIYANPTDVVWMNWTGEIENIEEFRGRDKKMGELHLANIKITSKKGKGEETVILPSRLVRHLSGITDFLRPDLLDKEENLVGFVYEVNGEKTGERQDVLFIDASALNKQLKQNEFKLIWFVDLLKRSNPWRTGFKQEEHFMKSFRWMVWKDGDEFKNIVL